MAMDMFIKIDDLKGESKDKTHAGEIDVLAWSWGMSQSGTTHVGGGSGSGKVNVQDISITKFVDASSAALQLSCANGKHYKTATLVCRKAGENPLEYIVITMTDLIISSISTGGSGGEDRLTENVTLNFANVKFSYTEQDAKGAAKTPKKEYTWNIAQNAAA